MCLLFYCKCRNAEDWKKGIERDSLVWENVCDLKGFAGAVPLTYRVNGIPNLYLIGPDGEIIANEIYGTGQKINEIFGD